MTDREQIEKMAQAMCGFCAVDKRCVLKCCAPCSEVASQDCTCKESAEELIYKGYGKVSEYKAEIERLKAGNCELTKKLEARLTCDFVKTAQKHAKIDVLNKAKERIKTAIDTYYNSDGGGYYLAEDAIDGIDELIKEIEEQ